MDDKCLGVDCLRCGEEAVVYNGSYWCESCGYVPPLKYTTRYLAGLIRYRRSLGRDTTREEFYLPDGHELKGQHGHRRSESSPAT